MLKIYKTNSEDKKLKEVKNINKDTWIDLTSPIEEEINEVVNVTKVDKDLILKMLDEEELPRIEQGEQGTLIVIDTPFLESNSYTTYPLGIIIVNDYIITISTKKNIMLDNFKNNLIKDFRTAKKTRFLIQLLLVTAKSYLRDLKQTYKNIENKEKVLKKSTENKDLLDMLEIEKTLVYFMTSLKANEIVLEKLSKGNVVPLFEGDLDLLEDTVIENSQAIEMSSIYRSILSSITDTYATVVSNNLNYIMKFLAGITIVISIPTMISSFLGMNVPLGIISTSNSAPIIIIIISILISLIVAIILKKKNML